jgi:single-strand DNA-binding protein
MASFNKIVIVGYCGRDPEIRYTADGTAVCSLSVATTEKTKRNGEVQDITTWFKLTVWGKLGEIANQYLSKGAQVYAEGRLSQQEYTDRDGNKRTSLEVKVSDIQFLDRKPQGNFDAQPQARAASATQANHQALGFGQRDDDQSVPF